MPRVEQKSKSKSTKKQPVNARTQTDYKILKVAGIALLVIAVLASAYLLLDKFVFNKENETEIKRYEDLTHITLSEYKWLLGEDESNPLTNIEHDVYIFVYNRDYEACELCESLEDEVKEAAAKASENGYSFFVLDYVKYPDIQTYVSGLFLPNRPGLIHISGDSYADTDAISTSENGILFVLNSIIK
ncbi:MAG: hypothetical protein RBQ91_03200 [Acholeplasma sp.]|nr:hypothetical protein [Acholeplasma sp.]